jgi:hypothetical protein
MTTPDLSIIIVNWNTRDLLRDCLASLPGARPGSSPRSSSSTTPRRTVRRPWSAGSFPGPGDRGRRQPGFRARQQPGPAAGARPGGPAPEPRHGLPAGFFDTAAADRGAAPRAWRVRPAADHARRRAHDQFRGVPVAALPLVATADRPAPGRALATLDPLHPCPAARGSRPPGRLRGRRLPADTPPALEAVGLLDERFFLYFEETDWCLRAWRAGLPILLCTGVEVVHLEGRTAELVSRFSLAQFQCSYRQFMAKHAGAGAVRAACGPGLGEGAAGDLACPATLVGRRRRLASRYAYEVRLQLCSDLAPVPPDAVRGAGRRP